MRHAATFLLRPTIWMSRADLDRLRAAEARESADPRHGAMPGAPRSSATDARDAGDAGDRERDIPECVAVGG